MSTLMDGSGDALRRLMEMRSNCAFYCELLDYYGPAILGSQTWNDDRNMSLFCATHDINVFAKHILSVSDEAFIILVLLNAAPRWQAEITKEKLQVSMNTTHVNDVTFAG
jgi:hypothetical protein